MARFCRYCGAELWEGASFCGNCGKAAQKEAPQKMEMNTPKFCRKCGTALYPGAKFCRKCGSKVGAPADSTPKEPLRQEVPPQAVPQKQSIPKPKAPLRQKVRPQAAPERPVDGPARGTVPDGRQLFRVFSLSRMAVFLLIGVFLINAGPSLLCAVKMTLQQAFLSDGQARACGLLARGLGGAFVYAAFLCMSPERVPLPERAVKTLLGCAPVYFALALNMFVSSNLVSSWALIRIFIFALAMSLVIVAAAFSAAADAGALHDRGLFKNMLLMFRHPLHSFLWLIAFWMITVVQTAVTVGLLRIPDRGTVTNDYASWLVISAAETLVIAFILKSMRRKALKWLSKNSRPSYEKNLHSSGAAAKEIALTGRISPVFAGTALALVLVGFALSVIRPAMPETDWEDEIDAELGADLRLSNFMLLSGSIPDALVYAERASERVGLLEAYSEKDEGTLLASAEKTGDIRTWRMYLALAGAEGTDEEDGKDAVGALEEAVIGEPMNLDLKGLLLSCYQSGMAGKLSPVQKDFRKEIVREYVLDGVYTYYLPEIPENDQELKETVEELKENTAFLEGYRNSISELDQLAAKGRMDTGDVDRFIRRAEEAPDDLNLQYAAGYAAAESACDDTRHLFGRAQERILRFVELVGEDNDPETLQNARLYAAQMLIKVRGYRQAADMLAEIDTDSVPGLTETVNALKMTALNGVEDPEEAYAFSKELLETSGETPLLLFKYGVAALKSGRREEMIDALERLSAYMLDKSITGKELYQIETWFYVMCTYITSNDNSSYTGYTYAFYSSLSWEDRQAMFSPFVLHYLEAMDQGYHHDPRIAAEELAAVLEARADLTYAAYLRGVIAFAAHDYETAVEYYSRACAVDPENAPFLFGLANAYDGVGDYQKAYDLCVRIQALIPKVNHEEDWYGIGFHNTGLLNKLADKLKEG